MTTSLVNLKAQAAARAVDLRIATQHREVAAARPMSEPSNKGAYERALAWEELCRERAQAANGRVIRHVEAHPVFAAFTPDTRATIARGAVD